MLTDTFFVWALSTQEAITCSKLTIEQGVKYVQS